MYITMSVIGTMSLGVKLPILKTGDNLIQAVCDSLESASQESNLKVEDNDIIAVTESIVARVEGNYATVDEIAEDIKRLYNNGNKLDSILVENPVLSRNRFAVVLRGIARAAKRVVVEYVIPKDEVGNALCDEKSFYELMTHHPVPENGTGEEQITQEYIREKLYDLILDYKHPATGMNYFNYYKEIIESEGAEYCPIFPFVLNRDLAESINAENVLVASVHNKIDIIERQGKCFTLADVCADKCKYGLYGSNKVDEETVKLFPRYGQKFVEQLQQEIKTATGKDVHCMIYGDGCFKCPKTGIWEELDPVVSPAYTSGLDRYPNEIKIKYFADDKFKDLHGEELNLAIKNEIREKESNLIGNMTSQGTTPRHLPDLLGSLADLTSGSGDKGTPVIWIKNYFNSYAD